MSKKSCPIRMIENLMSPLIRNHICTNEYTLLGREGRFSLSIGYTDVRYDSH